METQRRWGSATYVHLWAQTSRSNCKACVAHLDSSNRVVNREFLREKGGKEPWGTRRVKTRKGGRILTGANVELWTAYAIVSGWTVVETLPVLPHPLPPQEQEEFGLAVYTAVVSGAHWAAFTDGVRSIASCRRNTQVQKYLICGYSNITVSIKVMNEWKYL